MKTAKQIIDYIRWNTQISDNNRSHYRLGYYDRVINGIKFFRFSDIDFDKSDNFSLCIKANNITLHIPYHRLRIIYNPDGKVIWKRKSKIKKVKDKNENGQNINK